MKSPKRTKSPKKKSSKSNRKSKDGRRSRSRKRSRVRIPVEKGKLFGYHLDMPTKERRNLLQRLMKKGLASFSQVIKRLNVLAIYNYKRHPDTSKKVRRDMAWVEKNLYSFRKSPMKIIPKGAASIIRTPSFTRIELPSPVAQKMMKLMSRPDIMKAMSTKKPMKHKMK